MPRAKWKPWPKGLSRQTFAAIPKRHRADAFQAAWVALLDGRNVDRAVRTYAKAEHQFDHRIADATKRNTPHDPAF